MKKLYFFMCCLFAVGQAQTFQWLQTPDINLTINNYYVGYCVASDSAGHAYFAGFRDNASSYNDIYGDCWFNKYDTDGTLLFTQTFSGKCAIFDMACDASGNVIMAIGWRESITIGTETLTTTEQGVEPLVLKLAPNGQMLWHYRPMIGSDPAPFFKAIATDASGNVYAAYDNFNYSLITKLSADGIAQFTISNYRANLINAVAVDSEGNIYGAGSCGDTTTTFAGVPSPTSLNYNTWIVKYSPTGTFQWVRYIEDITCSRPRLSISSPDSIYMSSYLFGPYSFGTLTANGPVGGSFNDFFITKLNGSGDFQWVRELPLAGNATPGNRNFLASDSGGNVYFSGSTINAVDWGNGITTASGNFQSDGLILKYSSDGNILMAKNFGGISGDRADAIALAPDGDIFVTGMARGNVTFGTITHEDATATNYPWIAKIDMGTLGTSPFENAQFQVWPNPVHDNLNISTGGKTVSGTISNILGQQVMQFSCNGASPVDVGALSRGTYFLRINGNVRKMVKE